MDVGQRVRDRREALGLTQSDLAHQADLTIGTISAIERGETVPKVTTALAIARALGMPVEALFGPANSTDRVETSRAAAASVEPLGAIGEDVTAARGRVGNRTSGEAA